MSFTASSPASWRRQPIPGRRPKDFVLEFIFRLEPAPSSSSRVRAGLAISRVYKVSQVIFSGFRSQLPAGRQRSRRKRTRFRSIVPSIESSGVLTDCAHLAYRSVVPASQGPEAPKGCRVEVSPKLWPRRQVGPSSSTYLLKFSGPPFLGFPQDTYQYYWSGDCGKTSQRRRRNCWLLPAAVAKHGIYRRQAAMRRRRVYPRKLLTAHTFSSVGETCRHPCNGVHRRRAYKLVSLLCISTVWLLVLSVGDKLWL